MSSGYHFILTNIYLDKWVLFLFNQYHITSNIPCILVGKNINDHSDAVGASPVGAARTTSSFSPGFHGLGNDNHKTRWEASNFGYLVLLILEVWRCVFFIQVAVITHGTAVTMIKWVSIYCHGLISDGRSDKTIIYIQWKGYHTSPIIAHCNPQLFRPYDVVGDAFRQKYQCRTSWNHIT